MLSRRFAALAAACVMAVSCAFTAYADDTEHKTDSNSQAESQADSQSDSSETESNSTAESTSSLDSTSAPDSSETTSSDTSSTGSITKTETSASKPKPAETVTSYTPVTEASRVALQVSDVSNSRFTVDLKLVPSTQIAGAKIRIEYDSSLFMLTGSEISKDKIKGYSSESRKDGVYTFTYVNTEGTLYNGIYTSLQFKVLDDSADTSVIYVNVESLEDTHLLPVPCNGQNGIVLIKKNSSVTDDSSLTDSSESEPDESEVITHPPCRVKLSTQLVTLDELGVPDVLYVRSVKVRDAQYAYYEKGALMLTQAGETELIVKYMSGKELTFGLIIEAEPNSTADIIDDPSETDNSGRNLFIAAMVMFAIAAIALEFMFIVKPFRAKKKAGDDEPEERFVAYNDDDAPDLVQNPEEVFARRVRADEADDTAAAPKSRNSDPQRRRPQGRRPADRRDRPDRPQQDRRNK